jgi:cell volume regulation protein A
VEGPSGTVLEGESGANDPVGIALMAALVSAGSLSLGAVGHVAGTFALQMVVGAAVGIVGARLLLWVMRSVPLPAEGLYPVRVLVAAGVLFGAATAAHGSGFLAVFVAGLLLGDERAPYKREIERFHSALASLAEIVAFAILGLTVDLDVLGRTDVWVPGLVVAFGLALLVRPLVGLPLLLPVALTRQERAFVLFAGLKGAVPLLLGSMLLPLEDGDRLYGVVIVVAMTSVVLQGSLVPSLARWLGIAMRHVEQQPYLVGVRLPRSPADAIRVTVDPGAPAAGHTLAQLPGLAEGTWVSAVVRDGALVPVRGDTVLRAGDDVLVLIDPEQPHEQVLGLFAAHPSPGAGQRPRSG